MEKLLRRVYLSKKLAVSLKIISHASALLCVISYIAMILHYCLAEPLMAVRLIFASGIPFLAVSILRRIINAPRPYELYEFYITKPKKKRGRSFPSRHVFSAFMIAGFAYSVSVWLMASLLVLGACMAAARVLLGMHFIRDVIAGALVGILSGVLGIILF